MFLLCRHPPLFFEPIVEAHKHVGEEDSIGRAAGDRFPGDPRPRVGEVLFALPAVPASSSDAATGSAASPPPASAGVSGCSAGRFSSERGTDPGTPDGLPDALAAAAAPLVGLPAGLLIVQRPCTERHLATSAPQAA